MGRLEVPGIAEVVQLLGLKVDPRQSINADAFNVQCPFCGDKKYHMNINAKKGCYSCVKCSQGEKGTGTLDLYGRVRSGTPHRKGTGGNGKTLLVSLLKEMGRLADDGAYVKRNDVITRSAPAPKSIPVASDCRLNAAFAFLLTFPAFALSPAHKANLLRRGLDEVTIARNGYATMPDTFEWLQAEKYRKCFQWINAEHLDGAAKNFTRTKRLSRNELAAGLALADEMVSAGINLKGVPGAFKLGKHWCFIYQAGMLIPTRAQNGLIVGLQTRTDSGNLRYLTISSKDLPEGPTEGISRTHFPLGNTPLDERPEVLLTEGPLKADIAVYLYGQPVFFAAVQGVNNTKEINRILRSVKLAGIEAAGNAFDMDKICNQNVRRGSLNLAKKIIDAHLRFYQKCWDYDYAKVKCAELEALCVKHGVKLARGSSNPFRHLAYLADALFAAGVPYCMKVNSKGEEEHDYWCDETKGIDDFLLSQRKKRENPEKSPAA